MKARVIANPVHPRGRGEQVLDALSGAKVDGSSPRTRGTGRRPQGLGRVFPVHPRGRGEQSSIVWPVDVVTGSSPRTRGTGVSWQQVERRHRFIPADAGNRSMRRTTGVNATVHPRGRGEQQRGSGHCGNGRGSSPRTRGTEVAAITARLVRRFIPADAGNRCGV